MARKTITVYVRPHVLLVHDGQDYGPGEPVQVDATEAASLLAQGAVSETPAPPPPAPEVVRVALHEENPEIGP